MEEEVMKIQKHTRTVVVLVVAMVCAALLQGCREEDPYPVLTQPTTNFQPPLGPCDRWPGSCLDPSDPGLDPLKIPDLTTPDPDLLQSTPELGVFQ
jgi:hypothetical protein